MRIESRSALRIFRGMRSTFPILFFCLAGGSAVIGASAELEAALKNFRAEAPRGWSYTQTTAAEGRSTVERSDAAKPEFDRWTLVQKDGRPPTAGETREYFENRSRRSRGGTAPKLVEQLDLSKLEALARDDIRTTYRCRLRPGEDGDKIAGFLRATLIVHRPSATLELIELHNVEPFSPTFGVRIAEMRTRMTYSLPVGDVPSLPQKVETRVRGSAFWFKSLDAELTVTFRDYVRATKRTPSS